MHSFYPEYGQFSSPSFSPKLIEVEDLVIHVMGPAFRELDGRGNNMYPAGLNKYHGFAGR